MAKIWGALAVLGALTVGGEAAAGGEGRVVLEHFDGRAVRLYGAMVREDACLTIARTLSGEWGKRGFKGAFRCREPGDAPLPQETEGFLLQLAVPNEEPLTFGVMLYELECHKVALAIRSYTRAAGDEMRFGCSPRGRRERS